MPHGALLLAFADAVIAGDAIVPARERVVVALGEAAMIDAAAVIAGFDGITRIADATGIPIEPAKAEQTADFRDALGLHGAGDDPIRHPVGHRASVGDAPRRISDR